jgi:hypothetical protein
MSKKASHVTEEGPTYLASREKVVTLDSGGRKKYGTVESRWIWASLGAPNVNILGSNVEAGRTWPLLA